MFKLINKFYPNKKINHKTNSPNIFNEESNLKLKNTFKIDDFVVIEKENSFENNIKKNTDCIDCNKIELLKSFMKSILTTVLDSRKDNNLNNSGTINNFTEKSFNKIIDDIFLCDDYLKNKNDVQKFIIEFYLINNKKNTVKSELIEKWKFSYKLNNYNDSKTNDLDINYLKKKALVMTKSIITYSRLLPLYQYILNKNNNDYSIDFKFYHNNVNKKGIFSNKPSGNVLLKNSILFSFKMNIKYYSQKEIKKIFNETEDYFGYIDIKNKSLSFHKTKPKVNIEFEKINDLNNNPINENTNNCLNEIKTCSTDLNNNKIKDIDTFSDSSSFFLNIHDFSKEENKTINISSNFEEIKENDNKKIENQTKDYNDNTGKRKYSIFSNSYETTEDYTPRNSDIKTNENKDNKIFSDNIKKFMLHKKDSKVNNILKEYNLLKDLIQKIPDFNNIKTQKLNTYIDIFE